MLVSLTADDSGTSCGSAAPEGKGLKLCKNSHKSRMQRACVCSIVGAAEAVEVRRRLFHLHPRYEGVMNIIEFHSV